jgi:hypothetical protein
MTNITVHAAVKAAMEFADGLVPRLAGTSFSVEEVERSEGDWLITLGYTDPDNPLSVLAPSSAQRRYKIFRVDAETGEVLSMKIREVNVA